MYSNRAGFHIRHQGGNLSTYSNYTFNPTPICDITIKLDDELCRLLASAHRQIGMLEGTCNQISGIENINCVLLKKEALASCMIDDNTNLAYIDLLTSPKRNADSLIPVLNIIKALDYGISAVKNSPLTSKMLLSTHGILMINKRRIYDINSSGAGGL